MRPTRASLLPLIAVVAMGTSACSESEDGTAEPEQRGSASSSMPTSSPSPDTRESSLASVDPCSLLKTDDITKHTPVVKPEHKTIANSPSCYWAAQPTDDASLRAAVGTAIRETGGVKDMTDQGQGVQHVEEDGREYGRVPSPQGCTIGISVTDSSRVDVLVSGVPAKDACELANSIVDLAEPNVPRG